MKKQIALVLALLMTCGVVSSCSSNSKANTSKKNTALETVKYVVPGDTPTDLAAVTKLINDKMAADGVHVAVQFQYYPWDSFDQKLNLMLSTGEEFDLFQIMNDRTSLSNYASRGALSDITSDISQYGSNIKAINPNIMMKSGQVGGKQYAIPADWFESSITSQTFIRTDILHKYGITDLPTNFQQLTDDYVTVMKKWTGPQKPYYPILGQSAFSFSINEKTYSEWPFTVIDKMFMVTQDGTISDYFESNAFKQDCANARLWYKDGIISSDAITVTNDQLTNQLNSGDWLTGGGGNNIATMLKNYPDLKTTDFAYVDFASDKPNVRPYGTRNMNAVPAASKHPDAAVKMVNWVYANQANYDLFMYGRKGVDYTPSIDSTGRQVRTSIIDPAKKTPLYSFQDWMMGNMKFERPEIGVPDTYNKEIYNFDKTAVNSPVAEFTFDATPVQTKYTDVQTTLTAVIPQMATGSVDYATAYPAALKKLKAAGIDDVINEYKAQYEKSKGK
ncbi:MAG TPA: extracellular solute-binding protein [Clostridiaceae bacterium]